jgi:peptidyl-tRNA hydrolase
MTIEPRCYFILNKELDMPVGKLAVQVGHGMDMVYEARDNAALNCSPSSFVGHLMRDNFHTWYSANRKKVVLKAKNDNEVQKYKEKLLDAGYVVMEIVDNGVNFFDGKTRTGLVVYPVKSEIPELKRLQVYK